MRHPVSTCLSVFDPTGAGVNGRVVFGAIGPDAPEHPSPGASQYAHCVRMIATALARGLGDAGSPGAGMAGIVCKTGDCPTQAVVASPSEGDGATLAGLVGDGYDASLGAELLGTGKALGYVTQFGQDLGGANATGARQRHHRDGLRQRGHGPGDMPIQGFDLCCERLEQGHQGQGGRGVGLGEHGFAQAWRGGLEAIEQHARRAPAAVALALAKGGDLPGGEFARGGPLLDKGQCDGRIDGGKDTSGARPVSIQQSGELVGRRTRVATKSSRVRTRARKPRMAADWGCKACQR